MKQLLLTRFVFLFPKTQINTVSLARALFIQPVCLLLDEPTNHLDMEAVLWLEDYLSKWKRILLLVSHSQDFLNNVCSHMVHFTNDKSLEYYNGNYDTFIKTKEDLAVNQMKQYKWEQEQIKSMKEYVSIIHHEHLLLLLLVMAERRSIVTDAPNSPLVHFAKQHTHTHRLL